MGRLRLSFFALWAVMMTALTYVLGAPALKVLRRRLGRGSYWIFVTLVTLVLFSLRFTGFDFRMLGLSFFSLALLMGVFDEFEEMSFSFTASAFFTLVINTLFAASAFSLWIYSAGPNWNQILLTALENSLKPVAELNPKVQLNYLDLLLQLPSIAVIFWMISLYVAVLLEGRLAIGEMAPAIKLPSLRPQLREFRLPDICVWLFILSLLGAFGDLHSRALEALAVNVMNVCVVLFFFQGLAVVVRFFANMHLGMFWQSIVLVLVLLQFFLFVSLIGFLDFWLNFRVRMNKRTQQMNREI